MCRPASGFEPVTAGAGRSVIYRSSHKSRSAHAVAKPALDRQKLPRGRTGLAIKYTRLDKSNCCAFTNEETQHKREIKRCNSGHYGG